MGITNSSRRREFLNAIQIGQMSSKVVISDVFSSLIIPEFDKIKLAELECFKYLDV